MNSDNSKRKCSEVETGQADANENTVKEGRIASSNAHVEELEASAPAVYFPDFYPEIPTLSQEELKAKEWLTPELVTEIKQYFPSEHDIQGPDGVRKKESLAKQMEELFPVERKFASWKQLQQSLAMFSRPWGFNSSHTTSKLICSFGKRTSDNCYESKGLRKRGPSAKDLIQCPFELRYAYCGYGRVARFEKLPSLRYQVKITGADYNHTCGLSPASRQLALRMSKKLGTPKERKEGNKRKKEDKNSNQMVSLACVVGKRQEAQDAVANLRPSFVSLQTALQEIMAHCQPATAAPKKIKGDRPSRFRLDAFGGFQHQPHAVLNVEAPIQHGDTLWRVKYCFTTQVLENGGQTATGMDMVSYGWDSIDGVANFVNGFLSSMGGTSHKVALSEGQTQLCQWWLPLSATEDLTKARLDIISSALKTLLTEDPSSFNNDSMVP